MPTGKYELCPSIQFIDVTVATLDCFRDSGRAPDKSKVQLLIYSSFTSLMVTAFVCVDVLGSSHFP